MADAGTVTALWAVTAGVSGYYQVSKQRDPFPVLMASGLGYGATAVLGQLVDWQVAAAIAALVCLGVVIYRIRPLVDGASALIGAKKPT